MASICYLSYKSLKENSHWKLVVAPTLNCVTALWNTNSLVPEELYNETQNLKFKDSELHLVNAIMADEL